MNRSACSAFTTGLPVPSYVSMWGLRGVWLSSLVFPGLSDTVEASTSGVLSLHRETKFIIGFNFAVTFSSPESFCVFFDITSAQYVELNWLLLNKTQKMIQFITYEVSLGQHVCKLVCGVSVFDLDLGVQTDSIEQPIRSNSVGSGDVSHCRISAFNDQLDHSFIVLKHIQSSFLTRGLDIWRNSINVFHHIDFIVRFVDHSQVSPIDLKHEKHFQEQKQLDPTVPEQANHPISVQCPKRWSQILLNCEKQKFVSCTSACWNKCMTSKNTQRSSRSGFRIFKISCKIGVLKQSQSALFSSVSHLTILFVLTCMMNVRYQAIQSFITGFGPFCDGSCELIYWP